MKTLKAKFGQFKRKIRRTGKKNVLNNNFNLFDETCGDCQVTDQITEFIKTKRISKKEIIRFYITEMTGLTEEEFEKNFLEGKKAKEKKDVSDSIMSAVEFKLRCDMEDIFKNKIKETDESKL